MGTLAKALTLGVGLLVGALCGCEKSAWQEPQSPARSPDERTWAEGPRVPYTTTATAGGVQGGELAEELARRVRAHFRGSTLDSDGRLAAVASRVARLTLLRRAPPDVLEVDEIARDRGIVGPTPFVFVVPYRQDGWREVDELMAAVPSNLRFTHLGVAVFETQGAVQGAVAVGTQHLVLESIPRQIAVNEKLTFKGKISEEYRESNWVWTLPDGSTRPLAATPDGAIDFATEPLGPGIHRFEALGVGPLGLEVLANFPVTVGSAPPVRPDEVVVDESDPVAALLELMNRERARAGTRPLARTPLLDRVALGHSTDMTDNHFFGHDSPVTGSPEDRVHAGGVRVVSYGENVARAPSASAAHRMLMSSPGHRKNIVDPRFTHVGIGVVSNRDARFPALTITQVFGRFPERLTDPAAFATRLFEEMNRARGQAGVTPVSRKRVLDIAARKIAARLAADPATKPEHVDKLARSSDFPGFAAREIGLLAMFPAVPEDVAGVKYLLDPTARFVGIAILQTEATAETPRTNVTLFVLSN
jgi:uncharacterized protein YkwD